MNFYSLERLLKFFLQIRKQLQQLSEDENTQLQMALHNILLDTSHHNWLLSMAPICHSSIQQQQHQRELRAVAKTLLRSVAALAVAAPLSQTRLSSAFHLASQLLLSDSAETMPPGYTVAGLQLLAALQEESELSSVSRRQRRPLSAQLRQTYRSVCVSLVPSLVCDTLLPAISGQLSGVARDAATLASLCRGVAEVCSALAESEGHTVRDLHLSSNPQIAYFLLYLATQDTICASHLINQQHSLGNIALGEDFVMEELAQASLHANAALRSFCSRGFLLSSLTQESPDASMIDGGNGEEPLDVAAEQRSATQLFDLYLQHLNSRDSSDVRVNHRSEVSRRECISTLMSLCHCGPWLDALCLSSRHTRQLTDIPSSQQRGRLLLETLLELCVVYSSKGSHNAGNSSGKSGVRERIDHGVFLLTLDFWLDTLDTLLFRALSNSANNNSYFNQNQVNDGDNDDDDGDDSVDSDAGEQVASLDVDVGLFGCPESETESGRWLLQCLLPRLLHTVVHLCLLPRVSGMVDEDDDEEETRWEATSQWRDTRHGCDELLSLCVASLGLRSALPLLLNTRSHCFSNSNSGSKDSHEEEVQEVWLFVLGQCPGVSQRWTQSRDATGTLALLQRIATQTLSMSEKHLRHIQHILSLSSTSVRNSSAGWVWRNGAEEQSVLQAALFLRSSWKFLAAYAQVGLTGSNEMLPILSVGADGVTPEVRHVTAIQGLTELSVALALCPGIATHSCVLSQGLSSQQPLTLVSHHTEWSTETGTQLSVAVSQAAETLRRLLLALRKPLLNSPAPAADTNTDKTSPATTSMVLATQLVEVSAQALRGILTLLQYSGSSEGQLTSLGAQSLNVVSSALVQWDTLPSYTKQLLDSGVASLLTAATYIATHCDSPSTLCSVATQTTHLCEGLATALFARASQLLPSVGNALCSMSTSTMPQSLTSQVCRMLFRYFGLCVAFFEGAVQETPQLSSLQKPEQFDVLQSQRLCALFPVLSLLLLQQPHLQSSFATNSNTDSHVDNRNANSGAVEEAMYPLIRQTLSVSSLLLQLSPSVAISESLVLGEMQEEAFQAHAALLQLFCWAAALCRDTLLAKQDGNSNNSRCDTLLHHIATQLCPNRLDSSVSPWNWLMTQHAKVLKPACRRVCVSLCRNIFALSNTEEAGIVPRCVAALRVVERHHTTLYQALFNSDVVEELQSGVTSEDEYHQGGVKMWHEQMRHLLYVSASVVFQSQRVSVAEEALTGLVLRVATQLLTLDNASQNSAHYGVAPSWRDTLVVSQMAQQQPNSGSVARLIAHRCVFGALSGILHHSAAAGSNSIKIGSTGSGTSDYSFSEADVCLLRESWRFVAALFTSNTLGHNVGNILWAEVCRDTLDMEAQGDAVLALVLQTVYVASTGGSAWATVATAAESALLLILAALHEATTSTSGTASVTAPSTVAVEVVERALNRSLPVLQEQFERIGSEHFTLKHVAFALLQQVALQTQQQQQARLAPNKMRRVKQLLTDLVRVAQGLQNAEILSDYFFFG